MEPIDFTQMNKKLCLAPLLLYLCVLKVRPGTPLEGALHKVQKDFSMNATNRNCETFT